MWWSLQAWLYITALGTFGRAGSLMKHVNGLFARSHFHPSLWNRDMIEKHSLERGLAVGSVLEWDKLSLWPRDCLGSHFRLGAQHQGSGKSEFKFSMPILVLQLSLPTQHDIVRGKWKRFGQEFH